MNSGRVLFFDIRQKVLREIGVNDTFERSKVSITREVDS